jgi:hypothetical protein
MIGNDVVDLAATKKAIITKRVLDKILKEQLLLLAVVWFMVS